MSVRERVRRLRSLLPRLRLRDVVIFTSAPLGLGVYLLVASVVDYRKSIQFDDWWSNRATVNGMFTDRVLAGIHWPRAVALRGRLDPEARDASIVRLRVDRDLWDAAFGDPQVGWGEWIDADLVRAGTIQRVEVRKRGDTSVHWTTPKKSFTLKTSKSSLFKGHREMSLSVKDVIPQYLATYIAGRFDLLVPSNRIAPVFLNERFYGLHRLIELPDELFLRQRGRMPGAIYQGDTAERGEVFKGVPRGLFENPYIWELEVENDRPAADGLESGMTRLVRDLSEPGFDAHRRLMSYLDREEIGQLMAAMLVAGDPYHMSNLHNQYWYEDPWSGTLHPIVWDLRLMELGDPPYAYLNNLFRAVLLDPFVVDRTLRSVHEQVGERALMRAVEAEARGIQARYRDYIAFEHFRRPFIPDIGSVNGALATLRRNVRVLRDWMANSEVAFHGALDDTVIVLDFETRGYAGADLLGFALAGDGLTKYGAPGLRADRDLDGSPSAGDRELPIETIAISDTLQGIRVDLTAPEPLLTAWDASPPELGIRPGRLHYRFFLTGPPEVLRRIERVRPLLRNRVTGERRPPVEWPAAATVRPDVGWHPWRYPEPEPRTHRLAGDLVIRDTLRVPEGDTLFIEPGTTLRLAPDISIVSRGVVLAPGTADRPITVRPLEARRPWGAFALQGPGATGSRLERVVFEEGGGAVVDRVEYSGMVNVHQATDVVMRGARFVRNLRTDDAFHAVNSEVTLVRCEFVGANSDAIDYDYSGGEIRDCTFEDSGNDAIDLMTSSPRVIGNTMKGSGDKGISIGEASHPLVFDNRITESEIGIEVKDRSEPLILNTAVVRNGIGLLQRVKNWRYDGGGWAKLVSSVVRDNDTDFRQDVDSRLTILRSHVSGLVTAEPDRAAQRVATWLYAERGIRVPEARPGPIPIWEEARPLAPIVELRFQDDFGAYSDDWLPVAAAEGVEKRDGALLLRLGPRHGGMRRTVDWSLEDSEGAYLLVLELATRNVESLRLTLRGERGTVSVPIEATDGLEFPRYVGVELPADRYSSIEIDGHRVPGADRVDPVSGFVELATGRVALHRLQVVRFPDGSIPAPRALSLGSEGGSP